jgi:hypothetical protein
VLKAHSGAVIATHSDEPAGVDGEVPVSYPSISAQVAQNEIDPGTVKLILLNGGLNDIDIRFILNPFTSSFDLTDQIRMHCLNGMRQLLTQAVARYQNALILVLGYYPILSRQSRLPKLPGFLDRIGTSVPTSAPITEVLEGSVQHSLFFWTESAERFQQAVDQVNRSISTSRAIFVDPKFSEMNSVFADVPWLFGLDEQFGPADPVAANRHAACDTCISPEDFFGRQTCYRASAGHPNIDGATQYAAQINSVLVSKGI